MRRLKLVPAAAAKDLEDGEEEVDGVQVDGERERDGGLAVATGADAGEVADREQREDAQGEPGVGIRRQEDANEDVDQAERGRHRPAALRYRCRSALR